MAHFRRRKPATRTFGRGIDKWRCKALEERGDFYSWLRNWPAWHDVVNHRRPPRRRTKAMEREIMLDRIDSDDAAWPVGKKPHSYWW